MDKLENCIAALRVLARQSNDPNVQLLAERRINEYLQREIDDLRTSLRQIGRAINAEADKRVEDENWRLMGKYVQSCRDRLLDIFGVWYKG
jgi:3-dehydroquinate dehydratase